jgi:hypothetical protein
VHKCGESFTKVVPNIKEKRDAKRSLPSGRGARWWLSANIENVAEERKKNKVTRVFPEDQKEGKKTMFLRKEKTTEENKVRECEVSMLKVSRLVLG